MKKYFPTVFYKFMPDSFLITESTLYVPNTLYISRPVNIKKCNYPSNSGLGIEIMNSEKSLNKIKQSLHKYDYIIASEYITNPLLIYETKFHFRIYIIISIINNKLSGYVFDKYFMTIFAKEKYKNSDYGNKKIHDTHSTYGEGIVFPNDIPFDKINYDNFNENDKINIINQIKEIAKYIIIIVSNYVILQKNCINGFHLFGSDFMIDETLQVKLIECNRFSNYNTFNQTVNNAFYNFLNEIILKPAFLNNNSCDSQALFQKKL